MNRNSVIALGMILNFLTGLNTLVFRRVSPERVSRRRIWTVTAFEDKTTISSS